MSKISLVNGSFTELCELLNSYGFRYIIRNNHININNKDLDEVQSVMYEHGFEWMLNDRFDTMIA